MFESIFKNSDLEVKSFMIILLASIITGIIFSFMCFIKSKSSKSFLITLALLPSSVAMVIMLVNGNIGAGIAVAGAFSLVRFRSAQGSAKEICSIFIAMAGGLAFGMGYLFYAVTFIIVAGLLLLLFNSIKIWDHKDNNEKLLRIYIPENLDYESVFMDVLLKYTKKFNLVKVKTTNLGSMFQLSYEIILKDPNNQKKFIDELRCQNGNLEVMIERVSFDGQDL